MAEAHSCVTLSPNNLEPIRGCLLAGAGALCVPEKRYTEDCSFACSLQEHRHPPSMLKMVLYSCGGSFVAKGVCRHQRSKNWLPLLQSQKERLVWSFFQNLHQSAFASKQNTPELVRLKITNIIYHDSVVLGWLSWGKLSWGWMVQDGLTHCLMVGRLADLEWPGQERLIPVHGRPVQASAREGSGFQKSAREGK